VLVKEGMLQEHSPLHLSCMLHSAIKLGLRLLLVLFLSLLSHHSQRRIDISVQCAGMRPSGAVDLGNTSGFLLPSYPGRGQRLGLERLDRSESAWQRHGVGGETGISVGALGESLMAD
jgi:hypothetical protein